MKTAEILVQFGEYFLFLPLFCVIIKWGVLFTEDVKCHYTKTLKYLHCEFIKNLSATDTDKSLLGLDQKATSFEVRVCGFLSIH